MVDTVMHLEFFFSMQFRKANSSYREYLNLGNELSACKYHMQVLCLFLNL